MPGGVHAADARHEAVLGGGERTDIIVLGMPVSRGSATLHRPLYGVNAWNASIQTEIGKAAVGAGNFSVADPRIAAGAREAAMATSRLLVTAPAWRSHSATL